MNAHLSTISKSTPLPPRLWPAVKLYLRPYWGRLAVVQLLAFVWSIDAMLLPLFMAKVIDAITGIADKDNALQAALPWMIAYIAIWPLLEVGYRGAGYLGARVMPNIRASIQTDLFQRLHQHDYGFLIDHQAGGLLSKIRDVSDGIMKLIDEFLWQFNNIALLITVSFFILLSVNVFFAAITFVVAGIYVAIGVLFARRVANQGAATAEARSTLTGHIVDSIGNFLAARSFAVRDAEFKAYDQKQEDERWHLYRNATLLEHIRLIYGVTGFLLVACTLVGGSFYGWYRGWLTAGDIVLVNGLALVILQRLWFLCNELPNLVQAVGAAQKALDLLALPPTILDAPQAGALQVTAGQIEFQNISFGYRADNPLFNGLSVVIPAGQKVGLVGYSGSGKTSFVRLIMRFYDVQAGKILIDGQDIASVSQDSLRRHIGFIPQDPELFHRTVRENILIGKPEASDEELWDAVTRAHAADFIRALPQGIDSIVGERGVKLSGGQRQRIAIARVAIRQAPILILDEATSALDSVTEAAVQESLTSLMADRTTIVIAHRLSTLLHMDRILVFDKGRLVEDGTVAQLLAAQGIFKTLWDAQVGGFLQDKPQEI